MARLVLLTILIGLVYVTACPPCEKLPTCPKSVTECPFGLVTDPCDCCSNGRCGLASGQLCYNLTFSDPEDKKYGLCATGLYCKLSPSEENPDFIEGNCACQENHPACGSDNHTYENICAFNEAALEEKHLEPLSVQHWGPCSMAPEIISKPQDVAAMIGQPVALDCEVKGFPAPQVTWEFTGSDGTVRLLPSDDPLVSVQVRGGPESQMSTSWVQIVQLRSSDVGMYSCIATNEKGETRAIAHVDVAGFLP